MVGGSKIYPWKVAGECGGGDNGETSGLHAKTSHAFMQQRVNASICMLCIYNDWYSTLLLQLLLLTCLSSAELSPEIIIIIKIKLTMKYIIIKHIMHDITKTIFGVRGEQD